MFEDRYVKLFDGRLYGICTFGLRIRQILSTSNISFDGIMENSPYFVLPDIVFGLVLLKKYINALVHRQHLLEMNKCCGFIPVYTDGSQDGNTVVSATAFPSEVLSKRLQL